MRAAGSDDEPFKHAHKMLLHPRHFIGREQLILIFKIPTQSLLRFRQFDTEVELSALLRNDIRVPLAWFLPCGWLERRAHSRIEFGQQFEFLQHEENLRQRSALKIPIGRKSETSREYG